MIKSIKSELFDKVQDANSEVDFCFLKEGEDCSIIRSTALDDSSASLPRALRVGSTIGRKIMSGATGAKRLIISD